MSKRAIIFDDDKECLNILEMICQGWGYDTNAFFSWKSDSIDEIVRINPDVIFLDEWFRTIKGSEICTILRSINQMSNTKIYLISAVTGLEEIAKSCKADGYIEKPFDIADIDSLLTY